MSMVDMVGVTGSNGERSLVDWTSNERDAAMGEMGNLMSFGVCYDFVSVYFRLTSFCPPSCRVALRDRIGG